MESVPFDAEDVEMGVELADQIANSGLHIYHELPKSGLSTEDTAKAEFLKAAADDLVNYIGEYAASAADEHPTDLTHSLRQLKRGTQHFDGLLRSASATHAKIEATDQQLIATEAKIKNLQELVNRSAARLEAIAEEQSQVVRDRLAVSMSDVDQRLVECDQLIGTRLDKFSAYEKKAEDILGAMGNKLLANGYAGNAKVEQYAAEILRVLSIVLMGVTSWILIDTLLKISVATADWKDALLRAVMSIILAVPTAYLAKEAGKHRAQSIELRRTALDFLALNPYLAEVSEQSSRDALKVELGKRIFFAERARDESSTSFPLDTQALAMKALDIAAEAVKKK